jgi:hypothetical protein
VERSNRARQIVGQAIAGQATDWRAIACAIMTLTLAGCSSAPKQSAGAFLDPGIAQVVLPDTKLLIALRVDKIADTPQFDRIAQNSFVRSVAEFTGVHPDQLWNIVLMSNGKQAVLVGRGKFASELFLTSPELVRPGMQQMRYKGVLMSGTEQEAVTFLNSSTAVVGDAGSLHWLIDNMAAAKGPPEALKAMLTQLPADAPLWGVYSGGVMKLDLPGNLANVDNVLRMTESASFSAIAEGSNSGDKNSGDKKNADKKWSATGTLTARSDESAKELRDTLAALSALAGLKVDVSGDGRAVKFAWRP